LTDEPTQSPLEVAVSNYIRLRDERAELKREHDAKDRPLKDMQDKIEAALLAHINKNGVKSLRVPAGTVSIVTKTRSSGEDWDAIYKYVLASGRLDLFARRLNDAVIEEIMGEGEDSAPPPGVKVDRVRTIQIRRSS